MTVGLGLCTSWRRARFILLITTANDHEVRDTNTPCRKMRVLASKSKIGTSLVAKLAAVAPPEDGGDRARFYAEAVKEVRPRGTIPGAEAPCRLQSAWVRRPHSDWIPDRYA